MQFALFLTFYILFIWAGFYALTERRKRLQMQRSWHAHVQQTRTNKTLELTRWRGI